MSNERIFVDDLLVLGNAVPDIISDQRITICTAGYSKKYGLIRVYPVPPSAPMRRWKVVSVPLERNPRDVRQESWKILGSHDEWDRLHNKVQAVGYVKKKEERRAILESLHAEFGALCVEDFNEKQVSLGMIIPDVHSYRLHKRDDYEPSAQTQLGKEKPFLTIKNYPLKPMVIYRCPTCKTKDPHDQQIVEWGLYEWMRRNPDKPEKIWANLHIGEEGYETSFLVGNMTQHHNSWIVISILRMKADR